MDDGSSQTFTAPTGYGPASWLSSAVFYQIYPASFADANGDGIGDLRGIEEHLDYIRELGADALWLCPVYDSPFRDGGYDIRDHRRIAPRYGSKQDMIALLKAAHDRGMHVLLDLVPGHTSDEHPMFQYSSSPEPNRWSNRYIWTDEWYKTAEGLTSISGVAPRNGSYVTNFFMFQPALNYGFAHPTAHWQSPAFGRDADDTCEEMIAIMRYWLALGADGFRVDMADSLVKHDDEGKPYTRRTWRRMFDTIRSEFPGAVFVSEWGHPAEAFDAGFDMDFYLDWRANGRPNGYNMLLRNTDTPASREHDLSYFNADSPCGIADFLAVYEPDLQAARRTGRYFDFITGNHDSIRVAPRLDPHEITLAWTTLLLMPGVPFIYYGDEIGMHYRDLPTKEGGYTRTGSRTPMQWTAASASTPNAGFSTADPDSLYLPIDDAPDAPNVADEIADPDSLWNATRTAIDLRRSSVAFTPGAAYETLFSSKTDRSFIFRRSLGNSHAVVAVNPSRNTESHPLYGEAGTIAFSIASPNGRLPEFGSGFLRLPPQSLAVLM